MTYWQGILLGLVQGLTEFLPVSSDGHLVLVGTLARVTTPGVVVEVALHVATLGAVLVVYGRRLLAVVLGALRGERENLHLIVLLIIGTIPAAFAGLLLKDLVEQTFDSLWWAGFGFLTTGTLLWSTNNRGGEDQVPGRATAFLIGVAQAIAILPGVSRSGSTVTVALWKRMSPTAAAEFSFLLAIPAIAGAAVLEGREGLHEIAAVGAAPLLVSCAVAFLSGVWAIQFLIAMLRRGRFYVFAPYCWAVGALTLALAAWRG